VFHAMSFPHGKARKERVTTPTHHVHILCTPWETAGADTPGVSVVEPPRSDTPAVPSLASVANSGPPASAPMTKDVVFDIDELAVSYGSALAVSGITLDIHKQSITALIGPSGCGKSTFLRCLNRMNDLVPSVKIDGKLLYHGTDIYDHSVDPIEVRRRIGMVF